mgnify:CR=1 FL=1
MIRRLMREVAARAEQARIRSASTRSASSFSEFQPSPAWIPQPESTWNRIFSVNFARCRASPRR